VIMMSSTDNNDRDHSMYSQTYHGLCISYRDRQKSSFDTKLKAMPLLSILDQTFFAPQDKRK